MTESKPSKSALKRQFTELQDLGEKLIGLTDTQLLALVTEPKLLEAVRFARSIGSRGALRRQKQLIGKLMREVDAEPVRLGLEKLGRRDLDDKRTFRDAEAWRERLCADPTTALPEFRVLVRKACDNLQALLHDYASANGDAARKALSRQIFREIHRELTTRMQTPTG